ncbi:MAG: hypothetical protein ACR2M2_06480, partial [Gaiellaceae bacterium]
LAIWYSGRIQDWSVMTDELLYAKLATAIASSGSPFPEVHGSSIAVYNQLYPLLIAPLYGALAPPEAFRVAHVLNAVVMASAVFPVYLLGRQILPRAWALAVAGLSIVIPWMVLTGFLMTEAAAYPAFVWAVLGLQLTIAAPSPRRDLLAIAALGLAILARTQFAALVIVLPLAILGHELGARLSLRDGIRQAVRAHRILAAAYAAGIALAALLAAVASFGSLLGVYAVTVEGSLLPSGVWAAAARHLDAVAIGCGLVPLILGGGWMVSTIGRSRIRPEHALATLSLVTVMLLTFEAASFSVRFGNSVVRDRYLFYIVPLLLIGSAAALRGAHRRHAAVGAGAVTTLFALTAAQLPFTVYPGVWVDSPASVLNEVLIEQSGALGTGTFVALLGLFTGLVLVLALLLSPRVPFAVLSLVAVLAFSVLTLRSEVDRVVQGTGLSGRPLAGPPGLVLDWVDTVVPEGERTALVAFPVSTAWDTTAIRWWDVELWNRSVTHAYVAGDENFRYTPFPHRTLEIDWSSGEAEGTDDAPPYVVAAPGDSRFLLAGREQATNLGFVVRRVDRPYRALWTSRGLQTDGWTTPGRTATIRAYARAEDRSQLILLRITLRAPDVAPAEYRLFTAGRTRADRLTAGEDTTETVRVCLSAGSVADIGLTSTSSAQILGVQLGPGVDDTRAVGVGVGPISVRSLGEC